MSETTPDPRRWKALVFISVAQLMVVLDAHHREHRAAPPAGRPRLLRRRPAVGCHRLHVGVRRPAPARWASRRPAGTQARLPRRPGRVRAGLRTRRRGNRHRNAAGRPRPAGRLRRTPRPGGTVPGRHHVHAGQGACHRVRGVQLDRHGRQRDRPAARRSPHRVRRLALVPLRQRDLRCCRRHRRPRLRPRAGRRTHRVSASTCPAPCSAPAASWPWSGASPVPRRRDGTPARPSPCSSPPRLCWWRSCSSSPAPRPRSCRCASSPTATAPASTSASGWP